MTHSQLKKKTQKNRNIKKKLTGNEREREVMNEEISENEGIVDGYCGDDEEMEEENDNNNNMDNGQLKLKKLILI